MIISLVLSILLVLSVGVYYVTQKLHREDNSISNHKTLRIMATIVYALYIFFLISVLKNYKTKSCKSLLMLFIFIIAAQMIMVLLREFNILQIDHRNKVILNTTLSASILFEFIASILCSDMITTK
jgi:cytochrome bd-type quinol oxidase subunit 2